MPEKELSIGHGYFSTPHKVGQELAHPSCV